MIDINRGQFKSSNEVQTVSNLTSLVSLCPCYFTTDLGVTVDCNLKLTAVSRQ